MKNEEFILIDKALNGDTQALEELMLGVKDLIYNLSLRMLGTTHDADDATQEIMIRIITQLSTFQKKSAFSTWVYRIATNYLINYKKSMFAQRPLSFEIYGADIDNGFIENREDLLQNVSAKLLADELKMSCTNVMLQCLDPESRCIYVLGVMLQADSKLCGEIFGITPEAYRQRLSRIRKKVGDFLSEYCGLTNTGKCNCQKRIGYAIQSQRLNPSQMEYSSLTQLNSPTAFGFKQAMEEMDEQSYIFSELPKYRSPESVRTYLMKILQSEAMNTITSQIHRVGEI